jgi:hypothetical protein
MLQKKVLGLCVILQNEQRKIVRCLPDLYMQAGSSGNSSDLYSGGSCFQSCSGH